MDNLELGVESESALGSAAQQENAVITDNENIEVNAEASVETNAASVDENVEEAELNEFELEQRLDEFETELDAALSAAENADITPYSRNALKQYKRYVNTFREQVTPFRELRTTVPEDQLPEALQMLSALHTVRMQGDAPRPDVAKFCEIFESKYGDVIPDLIRTFGARQAPGSELNYFATALQQQYGIDPKQLEAVKDYLANTTIPDVPQEYTEAYRRMTPKMKEEFPFLSEELQKDMLMREQRQFEIERAATQTTEQREAQLRQEVEVEAESRYIKTTNVVMDALAQTLQKAQFSSDPLDNEVTQEQVLHLVMNAANPYSAGYERANNTLGKLGVTLDKARINNLLDTVAEESRNSVYWSRQNQTDKARSAESKIARAQQELIAQGHKAVSQILKVKGQGVVAGAKGQAEAMKQTLASPVINGNGSIDQKQADWLEKLPYGTPEFHQALAQLVSQQN